MESPNFFHFVSYLVIETAKQLHFYLFLSQTGFYGVPIEGR